MATPMRLRYHTTQLTTIAIAVTGLRVVPARLPGPRGRPGGLAWSSRSLAVSFQDGNPPQSGFPMPDAGDKKFQRCLVAPNYLTSVRHTSKQHRSTTPKLAAPSGKTCALAPPWHRPTSADAECQGLFGRRERSLRAGRPSPVFSVSPTLSGTSSPATPVP